MIKTRKKIKGENKMKKILISLSVIFFCTYSYADYSTNPKCRGYSVLEQGERQKCVAANKNLPINLKKSKKITKVAIPAPEDLKEKTSGFLKKLKVNTDSKLLKTGKYSDKK